MSEPLRTAPADAPVTDADREALIEKLLLAGLDHYFEGRYEQAVDVWTRVVFLERGHGRARAYIERARGALAERQRQADELLHRGVEAYESGELQAARDLLTRAAAEGGANETALVFLQRLGRVDLSENAPGARPLAATDTAQEPRFASARRLRRSRGREGDRRAATNWTTTVVASVLVAGAILLAAQPIASWLGELPVSAPVVESREPEPLPIVRASEARIARARDLYASGRLRDALRLLETIDPADPFRGEADRLTAGIQRDLLATVTTPSATAREAAR